MTRAMIFSLGIMSLFWEDRSYVVETVYIQNHRWSEISLPQKTGISMQFLFLFQNKCHLSHLLSRVHCTWNISLILRYWDKKCSHRFHQRFFSWNEKTWGMETELSTFICFVSWMMAHSWRIACGKTASYAWKHHTERVKEPETKGEHRWGMESQFTERLPFQDNRGEKREEEGNMWLCYKFF